MLIDLYILSYTVTKSTPNLQLLSIILLLDDLARAVGGSGQGRVEIGLQGHEGEIDHGLR